MLSKRLHEPYEGQLTRHNDSLSLCSSNICNSYYMVKGASSLSGMVFLAVLSCNLVSFVVSPYH